MTSHPNRGQPSRHALELIAKLSAGGIALSLEQQGAIRIICNQARIIARVAEARCNGDLPIRHVDQDAWRALLDRRELRAAQRIKAMADMIPQIAAVHMGGDPRGMTVKLQMMPPYDRLHDDWGREGVCVPGS